MNHSIILFDGVCNFCNFWVKFVAKRDKAMQFKFASIQSDAGQNLLREYNVGGDHLSSVILIQDQKVHRLSSAALHICKHLDGGWKLLYLLIIVPAFIRDGIYSFVAKNRYKWFGKTEACMIPTAELKTRFIE